MRQKYKILVTGKDKAVIDEIFINTKAAMECLSTSGRLEDVMGHLKYLEPDAFVYCLKAEEAENINTVKKLAPRMRQSHIPFIIIGDQADCNGFQKLAYDTADLVLTKPITLGKISENIIREIREREQQKLAAEKQKTEQEAPQKEEKKEMGAAMAILHELEEVATGTRRKHILVVDDDPRMLKVIRAQLKDQFDVASAVNGNLALKFLEKRTTDLILLDYEMPGMKGPDVFKAIKENPELAGIPIVFLTGVGELSKVQEVLEMKPQGYLLKPVDRNKLQTCVEQLLG